MNTKGSKSTSPSSKRTHVDDDDDDVVDDKMSIRSSDDNFSEMLTIDDDDTNHQSDHLGSGTSTHNQEVMAIAAETRAVYWSKVLVLLILTVITVVVATTIHRAMSQQEQDEFAVQFQKDAQKILEGFGHALSMTLESTDTFMVHLVSHAQYSNASWPFVTLPDFAVKAGQLRRFNHASWVSCYPLVSDQQRNEWEQYSAQHGNAWVQEGLRLQAATTTTTTSNHITTSTNTNANSTGIHNSLGSPNLGPGPFFPMWTSAPVLSSTIHPQPYNWDLYGLFQPEVAELLHHHQVVLGRTGNLPDSSNTNPSMDKSEDQQMAAWLSGQEDSTSHEPFTSFYYPIIDHANDAMSVPDVANHTVVGIIRITLFWSQLLTNHLPAGSNGIVVVMDNECHSSFSYQVMGPAVEYLGPGDHHDAEYESMGHFSPLLPTLDAAIATSDRTTTTTYTGISLNDQFCPYSIRVYPSDLVQDEYLTRNPVLYTVAAVLIFALTCIVFCVYDMVNEQRQRKVRRMALQASAIVSSLFPSVVRDRLLPGGGVGSGSGKEEKHHHHHNKMMMESPKLRLQHLLREGGSHGSATPPHDNDSTGSSTKKQQQQPSPPRESNPIAELFPETTVLFADIAGFTAWSSVREPSRVFMLLETLYGAFDRIARRRDVFKVETIGDSYVAVTGLPDPQPQHAVIMARFARDCRNTMVQSVRELELTLGPGTADLHIRIGLNSGPVTAGVLRGDKSRFQLFGDTVNTAARMESTGKPGRIQISQSTADLLFAAGKHHWITRRDELVEAKGKGKMQTFWVEPQSSHYHNHHNNHNHNNPRMVVDTEAGTDAYAMAGTLAVDSVTSRLVGWNVDVFTRLLQKIISRRMAITSASVASSGAPGSPVKAATAPPLSSQSLLVAQQFKSRDQMVLDEVKDIIVMPVFDPDVASRQVDPSSIELDPAVKEELQSFIMAVATMYNPNPFHNFEHASHVTMSVMKLLNRITASDKAYEATRDSGGTKDIAATLHDHSYGITSDPLTQFACVFAALIHDVDHPGVPNAQLIKETSRLAAAYQNKSVAEQNSVDLAWNLLMEYKVLLSTICADEAEMLRFRELVVNMVMATDIMDKDLKALRNARWDKAFSDQGKQNDDSSQEAVSRKATIVLEHLIQASNVAHTMQHWHIYRRWNELLFEEMYVAYLNGRSAIDPSKHWYMGEIGFFDFYVIPLAKKLRDCGVFGVSSDEYLNYAMKNREEWEGKGTEAVAAMIEKIIKRKAT